MKMVSHYEHACFLEIPDVTERSSTTAGYRRIHILSEEMQRQSSHLCLEMYEVQPPDEVQVPLLPSPVYDGYTDRNVRVIAFSTSRNMVTLAEYRDWIGDGTFSF